jgi:hypothetical protein
MMDLFSLDVLFQRADEAAAAAATTSALRCAQHTHEREHKHMHTRSATQQVTSDGLVGARRWKRDKGRARLAQNSSAPSSLSAIIMSVGLAAAATRERDLSRAYREVNDAALVSAGRSAAAKSGSSGGRDGRTYKLLKNEDADEEQVETM